MNSRNVRLLLLSACGILLSLASAYRICAVDIWAPDENALRVLGYRREIAASLGEDSGPVKEPGAVTPDMDVRRFKKEGWNIVVYFHDDISNRVIISKQSGERLTDKDIAAFLSPMKLSWEKWKEPGRRGWINANKGGPRFALVTKDNKALEIITDDYVYLLGMRLWLESADPK